MVVVMERTGASAGVVIWRSCTQGSPAKPGSALGYLPVRAPEGARRVWVWSW